MKRLLGLSALIMFAASGCRMCACPYDYCGPVVECGCMGGEGCGCGSAGPMEGPMDEGSAPMDGETISPGTPQPAPAPMNTPTSSNRSASRRIQQAGYSTR
jgi:hypothetical protein